MQHQVLIYGHDLILLRTRELILKRAGFDVCVTDLPGDVQRILATRHVDLLILCQTVNEAERSRIMATAHACQKSLSTLLLAPGVGNSSSSENDTIFSTLDGPQRFLGAVCRLTHEPVPSPSFSNSSDTRQELCPDLMER
jgi:hypothetical protein